MMRNRKLVLLTQYFPPEMGAPQNRLWETAKGLQKKDWDVSVITALPNYPLGKIFNGYRGKLYKKEKKEGIDILRLWLHPSNSRKSLPRIVSMLSFSFSSLFSCFRLLITRPAIIIVESPPLTLAFTAWILSKFGGSKLVMNVSDLWPLSAYELGSISKGKLYSFLERLEKFLYDKSEACLGQSQQIVNYIKSISSVETHLFRNGVDTSRFSNNSKDEISPTFTIVYAGLLGVAQGIVTLCEKIDFKKLGLEFHIYGDGAEKQQLKEFLEKNKNSGIYYHSSVSRDKIPSVLQKYDIALVPLVKPIFGAVPSKIYEAMAAGLPIIFMGGGEGEQLVSENNSGWICPPSDFVTLEKKLIEIKNLAPAELKELKDHCKQVAKELFDRRKQIDLLHDFLLRLSY